MINRFNAQPQSYYQHKPETWLGATLLERRPEEKPHVPNTDCCAVCTPKGKLCPCHQQRIPTTPEWDESEMQLEVQKEERQDSDWDVDL